MKKEKPDISVIVCHHTGDLLFDFLKSVKKSVGVKYEIIVITSDDDLASKGIPDCLVYHSTDGPSGKRNTGALLSNSNYLAYFDDDTEISETCLLEYHNFLQTVPNTGMVYGKIHKHGTTRFDEAGGYLTWTGFIWSRAEQNVEDTGQYDTTERIFAGKSASCCIRKDVLLTAGWFDEDFGILGEESDVSWRVWLMGYDVVYLPCAFATHKFNTPFKPVKKYYTNERVYFNGCRNYITMLIKNLETRNLWRVLPIHLIIWIFAGLAMAITFNMIASYHIFRGLLYVVRNLPSILKKRKKIQSRRKVDDRDIWAHIYRRTHCTYYFQRFYRYIRTGLHG
jgi:GT2 family glycosyltransferase